MTRWAIGLSVGLMLVTSVANAMPGDDRCDCGSRETVLPQSGATGVPRNTKMWAVGRNYDSDMELRSEKGASLTVGAREVGGETRVVTRYDIPDLEAQREYVAEAVERGPTTRFTTGPDVDLVAPAAPLIRGAGIAITPARDAEHGDVGELQLDAGFDADTALVRIEISGTPSPIRILTVPREWRWVGKPACETQLLVRPGDQVQIAVTAIDLAGNESTPSVQRVVVATGSSPRDPCASRFHRRCGAAGALFMFLAMISIVGIAIVVAVLIALILRQRSRRRALRFAVAEPLSLLASERLVRGRQVRAGLLAALGAAGILVFAIQLGSGGFVAAMSMVVAGIGLHGFVVARACLAMIESGRAEVFSLAHRVVVKVGEVERWIDLDAGTIADARRRYGVPPSTARAVPSNRRG